jgi:hypothetical protein
LIREVIERCDDTTPTNNTTNIVPDSIITTYVHTVRDWARSCNIYLGAAVTGRSQWHSEAAAATVYVEMTD